jgi:hypothetical protein
MVVRLVTSGATFRGMGRAEGDWVVLTDVDRMADGAGPVRGELRVPLAHVEWVQVLPVTVALERPPAVAPSPGGAY